MSGEVERVVLAHGGGGELMNRLLREHVLEAVENETLNQLTDGALLEDLCGRPVLTTDSYVVTPIEFPGGDIGRLAVCGTVNDVAVMGARPVALSLGLILEEGLEIAALRRVMASIRQACDEAGVRIVTGDTKVIERRGDSPGLMINTAGLGALREGVEIDARRIQPGDAILINGTIADHGLAVMSLRNGIAFETALRTDAAPLNGLIEAVLDAGVDVKFMRDATRGGLAGVLADISEATGLSVEIEEEQIPLSATARHAAEMLGLDPLTVANEGKVVMVVSEPDVPQVLRVLRENPQGRQAAVVGWVTRSEPPLVELVTFAGGRRVVQRPYGEDLPRIC